MDFTQTEAYQNYHKTEEVDTTGRLESAPKQYQVEKKEVSPNIKEFDEKSKQRRLLASNPFDYNEVSKNKKTEVMPPASEMITDPTYNHIAKFLGVDTKKEWNQFADKVYHLTQWAKEKVGDDLNLIVRFLTEKINESPAMSNKRINDLFIYSKL